jgi:hypothetical protein
MADVALARLQLLNLRSVNVEPEGFKPCFGKTAGQRQPCVTQAKDPHARAAIVELRDCTFPQTGHQFISLSQSVRTTGERRPARLFRQRNRNQHIQTVGAGESCKVGVSSAGRASRRDASSAIWVGRARCSFVAA